MTTETVRLLVEGRFRWSPDGYRDFGFAGFFNPVMKEQTRQTKRIEHVLYESGICVL